MNRHGCDIHMRVSNENEPPAGEDSRWWLVIGLYKYRSPLESGYQ